MTGLGSIARPMDLSPGCDHLPLIVFEVDVEVIEHVVLDAGRDGAKFVEFGQRGAGFGALGDEPRLDVAQSALKLRVAERARCVLFKIQRGRLHCCSREVIDSKENISARSKKKPPLIVGAVLSCIRNPEVSLGAASANAAALKQGLS